LDGFRRVRAARALAELLLLLATLGGSDRVWAAGGLAGLGDPRGADLLHTLATATTLHRSDRARAARELAELGDPRAADLLG
ncbi:hypothetical protein, partial [Streptomyces sp. NPDC007000]|uniref:hypothetical protein n=1 Tax=Streptomyces sp. NPDC007000 TaxID=3155357 RepID=UPI0033CF109C